MMGLLLPMLLLLQGPKSHAAKLQRSPELVHEHQPLGPGASSTPRVVIELPYQAAPMVAVNDALRAPSSLRYRFHACCALKACHWNYPLRAPIGIACPGTCVGSMPQSTTETQLESLSCLRLATHRQKARGWLHDWDYLEGT